MLPTTLHVFLMKTLPILLISICVLFTLQSHAQKPGEPPAKSSSAISKEEIFHHAKYLASDALEGRGTGTVGNDIAAQYIKNEFLRYELAPMGEQQSFFQKFEVVTKIELGKNNVCSIMNDGKASAFEVTKDFIPLSFSMSSSVKGEIVFAGYGITAPGQNHDDYADVDMNGKIAMVFSGYPNEDNPHNPMASLGTIRSKALFAREAGALALIVVRPDTSVDDLYKLKYDNSATNAGIICINITRTAAEKILAGSGKSIKTLHEGVKAKTLKAISLTGVMANISTDVKEIRNASTNVIGVIPGKDEKLKEEYIVVGAHFDHLGWGQDGSLYRGKDPMIHNGADDNASGTSALLELAQFFSAKENSTSRSLLFIAFSGEEMGLLGSSYFVQHPTIPLAKISVMINLDMIGRYADSTKELNVHGVGTSPGLKALVDEINQKYHFNIKSSDDGQGPSDHASFYNKEIPVLFFFTGLHSDYHKPSDDFDKLNPEGEEKIARFTADAITSLANKSEKLAYTKVKRTQDQQVRGFSVYVGTIPDYSYDKGFRITGVSDGGPAQKAGLQGGDIIVKFGSTKVTSIYDYMGALGQHKPGEDVPVVIKRGEEEKTVTIHLERK